MRSLRIFLGIAFLFHTLYILGAGQLHLLPQPQQCILAIGYFVMGKMRLSTPVLSQEWKQFVTEMGGTLADQSASSINIKLIDTIENIPVNQDYGRGCSRAWRILGDADTFSIERSGWKKKSFAMLYDH